MPTKPRPGGTPDEEFEAWFIRLDVTIEGTYNMDALGQFMKDRAQQDGFTAPGENAIRGMWDHVEKGWDFKEVGIKSFVMRATIGPSLRFGITGMRGAFGITRAREIYTERTGEAAPW